MFSIKNFVLSLKNAKFMSIYYSVLMYVRLATHDNDVLIFIVHEKKLTFFQLKCTKLFNGSIGFLFNLFLIEHVHCVSNKIKMS